MLKKALCLLAAVALAGCGPAGEQDLGPEASLLTGPSVVTIQYGQERLVDGTVVRLSFGGVLEDSRCPTDALILCVWEGNARVEVGIAAGMEPTIPLRLNTTLQPRSAEWNGVLVTLVEVSPARSTTDEIPLEDYSVTIRLEPSR